MCIGAKRAGKVRVQNETSRLSKIKKRNDDVFWEKRNLRDKAKHFLRQFLTYLAVTIALIMILGLARKASIPKKEITRLIYSENK